MIKEVTAQELNTQSFINDKVKEIQHFVGNGMAINTLSGGVDLSTRNRSAVSCRRGIVRLSTGLRIFILKL
jgi:GMP synthase PP-ATPase subunit